MITWIKEVNNFQIPKAQPQDVASLLLDMTISAWGYLKSVAYKNKRVFLENLSISKASYKESKLQTTFKNLDVSKATLCLTIKY